MSICTYSDSQQKHSEAVFLMEKCYYIISLEIKQQASFYSYFPDNASIFLSVGKMLRMYAAIFTRHSKTKYACSVLVDFKCTFALTHNNIAFLPIIAPEYLLWPVLLFYCSRTPVMLTSYQWEDNGIFFRTCVIIGTVQSLGCFFPFLLISRAVIHSMSGFHRQYLHKHEKDENNKNKLILIAIRQLYVYLTFKGYRTLTQKSFCLQSQAWSRLIF